MARDTVTEVSAKLVVIQGGGVSSTVIYGWMMLFPEEMSHTGVSETVKDIHSFEPLISRLWSYSKKVI